MAITQTRRCFVTCARIRPGLLALAGVGRCRTWWPRKIARRRAAAGNHHDPPRERILVTLHHACRWPRSCCRAEGFTDIRYVELTEAHMRAAEAANVSVNDQMIRKR